MGLQLFPQWQAWVERTLLSYYYYSSLDPHAPFIHTSVELFIHTFAHSFMDAVSSLLGGGEREDKLYSVQGSVMNTTSGFPITKSFLPFLCFREEQERLGGERGAGCSWKFKAKVGEERNRMFQKGGGASQWGCRVSCAASQWIWIDLEVFYCLDRRLPKWMLNECCFNIMSFRLIFCENYICVFKKVDKRSSKTK